VGYQVKHRPQNRVEIFLGLDERDLREGKLRTFAAGGLQTPPAIALVALDPGHGGDGDGGARVQGGVEGQLAWQLTMQLADLLTRESGVDVVFTRDEDESPDPLARAETANRVNADVFISIHLHNRPGGPQAYVADVKDGEATSSATMAGMGFRSFGAGQAPHVSTSRMIAREVLDATSARLRQDGGGVLGERLPQLGAAAMPAILIELGSGADRKWTRERLEAAAAGIAEGLRLYLASGDGDER
jgi:N-acetylmuramoyl-L-alanine amidase